MLLRWLYFEFPSRVQYRGKVLEGACSRTKRRDLNFSQKFFDDFLIQSKDEMGGPASYGRLNYFSLRMAHRHYYGLAGIEKHFKARFGTMAESAHMFSIAEP